MRDLRNELGVEALRCRGSYLEKAPEEIWGDPLWFVEPKIDGRRLTMQIGSERSLLVGRNRQDHQKGVKAAGKFRDLSDNNPHIARIACSELDGTMLDGELTETYNSKGQIDKPTRERIDAGFFVGYTTWGVMFWRGRDVRRESERNRYEMARRAIAILRDERLRLVDRYPCTLFMVERMFRFGTEGVVAKNWHAPLVIDGKTNDSWYKIKGHDKRTVDAFVMGVTEGRSGGSGVNGVKPVMDGTAASFTMGMMHEGKVMEVGKLKHLPEDMRLRGFREFEKYDGTVMEMKVSGWTGTMFRWPKLVKVRDDKGPEDCQFDEQVGGHRR